MEFKKNDFLDDESLFYNDDMELPKRDTLDLLEEINDRLIRIENMLNKKEVVNNPVPMQENLQNVLHAPSNVRPKGSMLEEIQSVLTAQDAMKDPMGGDAIDTTCTLSSDIIDDEI